MNFFTIKMYLNIIIKADLPFYCPSSNYDRISAKHRTQNRLYYVNVGSGRFIKLNSNDFY